MSQVQQQFGNATRQQGPVGQPPITRWFYPQFTVTFEGEHVVQSVLVFVPKAPLNTEAEAATHSTSPAPPGPAVNAPASPAQVKPEANKAENKKTDQEESEVDLF